MKITELYKIIVDNPSSTDAEVFYWNNSDVNIEYDGDTYVPEAITRSDMSQTNEINRQDIRLTIAPDNPLAQIFYKNPPESVTTVTIFRLEGPDVLVYWKGRVVSTRSSDWECIVECESVFTSMRRTGVRARYQIQCRHALYGTSCGVDKNNFAVVGTVTDVGTTSLVVTGADAQPDGYYIGGMVEYNGVFRFIVGHTGTTINLWRQFNEVSADDSVTLYPGCDRSLAMCDERFNNAVNHGGFPWLPNSNPFRFINIF
jgi:uncharacterized phage protein (TIGR02218 family)